MLFRISNQIHLYRLNGETWSKCLRRRRRPPPACSMSNRLSICYGRPKTGGEVQQPRWRNEPQCIHCLHPGTKYALDTELSSIQAVIAGKGISFSLYESLLSKSYSLVVDIGHMQWSVIAVRILGQLESNRTGMQILLIERKISEGTTSSTTCIYTTVGTLFVLEPIRTYSTGIQRSRQNYVDCLVRT